MQTNCRDILSLGILSAVLLTGAGIIKAERGFAQTGASSSHRAVDAVKMPPTMAPPTRRQTQEMPRPQSPPVTTQMPPPVSMPPSQPPPGQSLQGVQPSNPATATPR